VLTVIVAAIRGATVGQFLIAVLLPMLSALLDATDLCQAHWRAAGECSELEAAARGPRTRAGRPQNATG